ncbi:DUF1318 domain-containing protein [candidate division KSB1 bacterium]|nr:DUF1318 domain-containing protein [candidate division KSB1 bacterium]
MIQKYVLTAPFAAVIALCLGCSIKAPEIVVTGEKTALENQMLGRFENIESANDVIASTRSIDPLPEGYTSSSVLEAIENQRLRRDELDELKRQHLVGEANDGFLAVINSERYEKDPILQDRVDRLVAQENNDRRTVFSRILTLYGAESAKNDSAIRQQLVRLYADDSQAGTMVQMPGGEWVEKQKR